MIKILKLHHISNIWLENLHLVCVLIMRVVMICSCRFKKQNLFPGFISTVSEKIKLNIR